MVSLDLELTELAESRDLVYTRYADDFTFSTGAAELGIARAMGVIRDTYAAMSRIGLRPHTAKTTVAKPGARKIVLGLLVDGDHVRLSKEFRERLSNHLRGIEKFGPEKHAVDRGFRSVLGLRRHLEGLASFANSVNPEIGARAASILAEVSWPL